MPTKYNKTKETGKKVSALLAIVIVLAILSVGTTLAYVVIRTTDLINIFMPPEVEVAVHGNVVTNNGDVDVYARANVVANWVDENGKILAENPRVDITVNTSTWERSEIDGFYYYKLKLEPDGLATPITDVTLADGESAPEGYKLQVMVLVTVIQATPADAVEEAWSVVTVNDDGTLAVD